MLYFTSIWRYPDTLPLTASMSSVDTCLPDAELWKKHAQSLARKLCGESNLARTMQIDHGAYCYHVLYDYGVIYLTFCEKTDSVGAAHAYLEEISREFTSLFADQIANESRPYKFIRFDMFMTKSRKIYAIPRATAWKAPAALDRRTYNRVMGIVDTPNHNSKGNTEILIVAGICSVFSILFLIWMLS